MESLQRPDHSLQARCRASSLTTLDRRLAQRQPKCDGGDTVDKSSYMGNSITTWHPSITLWYSYSLMHDTRVSSIFLSVHTLSPRITYWLFCYQLSTILTYSFCTQLPHSQILSLHLIFHLHQYVLPDLSFSLWSTCAVYLQTDRLSPSIHFNPSERIQYAANFHRPRRPVFFKPP